MEKKIILFTGFSRIDYVKSIRTSHDLSHYELWSIHKRKPKSVSQQAFLNAMDRSIFIDDILDRNFWEDISQRISVVTCTQERDIGTYITVLRKTNRITCEQENLYRKSINKDTFKKTLSAKYPELTPKTFNEVDVLSGDVTYPVVGKPTGLCGSSYVTILQSNTETSDYIKLVNRNLQQRSEDFDHDSHLIFEEYLLGDLLSVNAFVHDTDTVFFCPLMKVEAAHSLDNTDDTYSALQYEITLPTEQQLELEKAIKKVISVFKIQNTAVHFDVFNHSGSFKFIEIGLRIGGLRQDFFSLTHETNHFLNDLRYRINCTQPEYVRKKHAVILQKACTQTGILSSMSYSRDITTFTKITEDKVAKLGQEVAPVKSGGSIVLRLFITGESSNSVIKDSRKLFDSITFNYLDSEKI